ncbi:pyrroline-5-carboxylate reductase [Rhodohalobacter mucosus]|uniref:Pyrroline-5-carboxylate reductase n=1 Tax=Rhodohalobacter mucosus TaxID=2079485 RepID=A0A316TVY7_9BACT|nr:pyrroline-5-carboxylate reductase [Rhodohalobacter mucosus]PWN08118.1 pyrroline-5-carboxylate reductase [Rhodohalobacter mucosus]
MGSNQNTMAILGAGNIGCAIADGLARSGEFSPSAITLTRRRTDKLESFENQGFRVTSDNLLAVNASKILILCVEPHQLNDLLSEISSALDPGRHLIISVVSGASIQSIQQQIPDGLPVTRAMPNTAIAIRESMTCICGSENDQKSLEATLQIFDTVGVTRVIREDQMTSATALCACGIAFFLRAIRAASQGGIEIGFDSTEAITMATQTALGAAGLLKAMKNHPEFEIDRVTTPKGCTISGLNQMEHGGFSSAMIRGIVTSSEKAEKLY